MGFFSRKKRRDPQIVTKEVFFPLKRDVATPLSQFLARQIGKGLPRFEEATGLPLTTPFGDISEATGVAGQRLREFLALDPTEFFAEKVAGPATKRFREDVLPEVREGFAGSLRGSGRFRTEEDVQQRFQEGLAQTEAQLSLALPQAQFQAASRYMEQQNRVNLTRYTEWLQSLPIFNPAINVAIQFLNRQTSTGKEILSALDPGTAGGPSGFSRLLGTLGGAGLGFAFAGPLGIPALAGAVGGGFFGSQLDLGF